MWHYARGLAFVATRNTKAASDEQAAFTIARKQIPAEATFGLNSAENVMKVADAVLSARITGSIDQWKKAVEAQDALAYDEPADWYYSVRESLGAAILKSGNAPEAEAVFREDLHRTPRSGRSLFGLLEALKAQKKTNDAQWVQREFDAAWKDSPLRLKIDDL